ncbi:hypothetical protein BH20VER3_BH20VER3_16880 [soil metagenome]
MKNQIDRFRAGLTACLLTSLALAGFVSAAEMSADDKKFLAQYEDVRTALAADNLEEAKKAATEMDDAGAALAKAGNITDARKEFATMSDRALKLVEGHEGYYHVNCPMLKKDWVQTTDQISNPYAGKSMPKCGTIKK